ncbi:energy transducer TonB [Roseovarius autotrophicus]|uniref:energy transducer TonB n=1 Tax=Roseovarius autotrophicus TaxID=2824121 RepID=UPI001B394214
MNTGQIISGAGHLALIGWALLGGAFRSDPPPFEVVEAMAISAEDYAALVAGQSAPEAVANVNTPEPPAPGENAPALVSGADSAPAQNQPEVNSAPPPDPAPSPPAPVPAPAEVTDTPPVIETPPEETAALMPEISPRPQPRPAPRVAPEPVAPAEPDVRVDDVARPEVAPDAGAVVEEAPQEATAPEEAATEIVTEAERPSEPAPTASLRPRARPAAARPEPAPPPAPAPPTETATRPAPIPTPAPTPPATDRGAVSDALAAALGQGTPTPERPAGPPLTAGEKDALRVAVQRCWNVGSLSSEALATTVVVTVRMFETSKPDNSSIRMLSHSGGSAAAAQQAYEAARRAIIRCGNDGFNLPPEKFEQWRDIEMTFNPERMRIK